MRQYLFLIIRIIVAVILLQTLRYKFLAHIDSIYIFTQVGIEPWGRIMTGVFELITAILLLVPKTVWMGAVMSAGLMFGAILMHLTLIGIEVNGDGGSLFYLAILTFLLSMILVWENRKTILEFKNMLIN